MWFCISSITHKYLFAKQVKCDEGVQSQSPSGSPRLHIHCAAGLPLYQFWPLYCLLSRVMIPKLEILHFQCCYSIYHRSCELGGNTAFNVGTKITAPGAKAKRGWPVERAQVVDGLGSSGQQNWSAVLHMERKPNSVPKEAHYWFTALSRHHLYYPCTLLYSEVIILTLKLF